MEKQLQFKVGKQVLVNRKGFTLIQTIFMFVIMGSIAILIPSQVNGKVLLRFECEKLKDYLLQAQIEAIENKQTVVVRIEGSSVFVNEKTNQLSNNTNCSSHEISFNERGNVNMAQTILCKSTNSQKEIVINLGSGNIYVK